MPNRASAPITSPSRLGDNALKAASIFWFLTALIGQWIFIAFIVRHYGAAGFLGDIATFNKKTLVGLVERDPGGNIVFITHVAMAGVITLGGTLQLIPQLRERYSALHRANGRLFIVLALLMGMGGLYLTWVRGASTSFAGAVSVSINGVLMIAAAIMTIRTALSRRFDRHHRWALRTFLLVNGVWFFRVGLFAWIIVNQGPLGIGKGFDGPFAVSLGFLQFLVPLAVFELYRLTMERAGNIGKIAMGGFLVALTVLMALGIYGALMFMWLPFMV